MKTKSLNLLLLSLVFAISVNATKYYVRATGGSDANNGTSEPTAFQTLAKAFNLSTLADGDVIDISGTFEYNTGKNLTKSITIQGTDKNKTSILGIAGAKKRCFTIGTTSIFPSVVIENVTFQDFDYFDDATSNSGAVINVAAGSALTCRNVNFLNNQAYSGGVISMGVGTAAFEDCYFYNNRTKRRTAATNADGGVFNVSISNATTADVSLIIDRCLFENNYTENLGSAVRFSSATTGKTKLLIQNSTFAGNCVKYPATSPTSGCIYLDVKSENADVSLINNTIAYNRSEVDASAARVGLSVNGVADKLVLINNILYSNTNATNSDVSISTSVQLKECKNNITSQNYKFENNTQADFCTSNISRVKEKDLGLATALTTTPGGAKVLILNSPSVAINAGSQTGTPKVDQRNQKRDDKPDIGSFEYTTNSKK